MLHTLIVNKILKYAFLLRDFQIRAKTVNTSFCFLKTNKTTKLEKNQ